MYKKKEIITVFILILAVFPLVIDPLLHSGIFTAHDIETNIIYFGAFQESFFEGNIIPRWAANVANLYGSPLNMFFYPFSYYLSMPLRMFGLSLIDSIKTFIIFSYILSSIFMYVWLRVHVNKLPAFIAAFLFAYAPYRINDIYARGSLAENTAFMFIPLVSYQIYKLMKYPGLRNSILLTVCLSALIISHPFMGVIFSLFFITYILALHLTRKKILFLTLSLFFSLMLTAFYIVPLLFENKYTHYDISPFNGNGYWSQFINLKQMLVPQWTFIDSKGKLEYQTYQIGLVQIVLFITSVLIVIWTYIKRKSIDVKAAGLFFAGLINFLLSIYLMLPLSNLVYIVLPVFQKIEFPWRFMSLNLFSLAIMTAAITTLIKEKFQYIFILIIGIISLILYLPYAKGHDYKNIPDSFYLYEIRENTDGFATLPRWAAQPEIYPRITDRFVVIEGEANIELLQRNSKKHVYSVDAKTPVRMEDATFYFPGWNVFIDGKDTPIQFQDPEYRGVITFEIPQGKHIVEVFFDSTKVRKYSDYISLFSIILLLIIFKYAKKVE